MTEWLNAFLGLPADALTAVGTIAVGGVLAGGTYVIARIKEARRPPEQAAGLPRVALDPTDRDMGFSLIRTGTDLSRALHEHGEILRAAFPLSPPLPPAPPPTRSHRNRRPQP